VRDLNVTLVQSELAWEDPDANRQHLARLIDQLAQPTDLVVLPEMFTTGFSMNALANAERTDGPTTDWLRQLARRHDCAVTGSIAVREGDAVYNRMLFVTPGERHHYDKRHLFRMAGEEKRYAAGSRRVIVAWREWRINLQVCYDLRFPVWSRNRSDYDLLLYVANWPGKRSYHWRQLLLARAIENQACVVGVNRIGSDANGLDYRGDSMVIAADGSVLADLADSDAVKTVTLDSSALLAYRKTFPCHLDADDFSLT
jgi:predicted amidohydrolase